MREAPLPPELRAHRWIGSASDPSVVVTYAWDGEDGLTFVDAKNDPHPQRDALVREAFANLEVYETGFEIVDSGAGRMLVSAGRPFAAERVMCESHMLDAHEKLDSDEVVVSVARRGTVLACAGDCADEVQHTMISLHHESWNDTSAVSERVLDELVVFRDGLKTGTLPVTTSGGGLLSWGPVLS